MPDSTNTPDVAAIIATPEAHGFAWFFDTVEKNGMKLSNVPLVRHLDLDKLRATFGDAMVLQAMDGTSRHVANQRIVRDARYENRNISADALKRMIVESMLGITTRKRTVVVETRFRAADGKDYATATEAEAASRAWAIDQALNAQQ